VGAGKNWNSVPQHSPNNRTKKEKEKKEKNSRKELLPSPYPPLTKIL
jgi:hypothetical protein